MITTEINKQTEKPKKKKKDRNRLCNKQTCIFIALIQGNEKNLM